MENVDIYHNHHRKANITPVDTKEYIIYGIIMYDTDLFLKKYGKAGKAYK